jgi:Putative translation factor (SUA5)
MSLVSMASLVAGGRSGAVISFATDTVPALAVRPSDRHKIYSLKQRPAQKPLILMADDLEELFAYIDTNHPDYAIWRATAAQYLPGALTLVLPVNELGKSLNPNFDKLGIRIPNHQGAIAVLQQTGALLTTSANLSGTEPLRDMRAIAEAFPEVLVWDCGAEMGSQPASTVAEWQGQWVILRQGAIQLG